MSIGMVFFAVVLLAGITWLVGSIALRIAGWLVMLSGILVITGGLSSSPVMAPLFGIVVFGLGAALWLAGHWLFAFKNHVFASGVAHRALLRLGDRFDPTRDWAIPVHDPDPHRRG